MDALKQRGIAFDAAGSTAYYLAAQGILQVSNTQDQIDLIEELVNATSSSQTLMVEIESKLVEVNQTDLDDITANLTYNMFGIVGSPLNNGGVYLPNVSATPLATAQGVANTGGNLTGPQLNTNLRGSSGFTTNSLDALEAQVNGAQTISNPNAFELGGVLNGRVFTLLLLTALAQKNNTDLLSAPILRVKNGDQCNN